MPLSTNQARHSIELTFSDQICNVQLEPKGDRYVVNYQLGTRGYALHSSTKTTEPVPYAKAKAIFLNLIDEKVLRGYRAANIESRPLGAEELA